MNQYLGLVQLLGLGKPLLPAVAKGAGILPERILQGLGTVGGIECAFGCLLGHGGHIAKAIPSIRNGLGGALNLTVKTELVHALPEHAREAPNPLDYVVAGFVMSLHASSPSGRSLAHLLEDFPQLLLERGRGEGLDHVAIGTCLGSRNDVLLLGLGCDHEDRNILEAGVSPDLLEHLE